MNKRLGCLSGSGFLAIAAALLVVISLVFINGGAMFSPGSLNAQTGQTPLGNVLAHADLAEQCSACHTAPWSRETMANRCLVCHTEEAAQLQDPQSLHSKMLPPGDPPTCRGCHTEHQGATAPLTVIDSERFPHEAVGYALQGHQTMSDGRPFTCDDCHQQDPTRFELSTCDDCHRNLDPSFIQTHVETFGRTCLACHDGLDTYGPVFDHNLVAFPLQGKHAPLTCSDCHQGAQTIADLQAAPPECFACHQQDDAHNGEFGQDCTRCHTPDTWEGATFDHSLTMFSLTGAHTETECTACHIDNVFKGTPQGCFACHQQDDAHNGEFGQDCTRCHTPDTWEGATFDHSLTMFSLTGAHTETECTACHIDNVFKGTPPECFACHTDPKMHAGLFGPECINCHTTNAWTPAQYNLPHTFPMDHREREIKPCQTCHPTDLQTYTCYGCHEHKPAEIQHKHLEEGIPQFQDCVQCHPTGYEDEAEKGE